MTMVLMMVAMMAPGAVPATITHARAGGGTRTAPLFAGTYLAMWALVGLALYTLYRQPSPAVAGMLVLAAGLYELTPIKQRFRRRARLAIRSGLDFGLCCLGSSLGLMLVLVAINLMSIPWMVAIAAIIAAQKILPERAVTDIGLGLAIIALGLVIFVDPSAVPGLANQSM